MDSARLRTRPPYPTRSARDIAQSATEEFVGTTQCWASFGPSAKTARSFRTRIAPRRWSPTPISCSNEQSHGGDNALRILVTGGCGFIGSALVLHLVEDLGHEVLNVDALTYAANPTSLAGLGDDPRHRLVRADICEAPRMRALVAEFAPDAIMHLAAESHVDRSITGPA